ncbi:MAG: hypothetical protein U9O98_07505 [Asgard group archaeon]|nr:hypothetical protein [Asgard group archaeon]
MKTWIKFFERSIPPNLLEAIKKKYSKLKNEYSFDPFPKAAKDIVKRLIKNNPELQSINNKLTDEELIKIQRVVLRILNYSIGIKNCEIFYQDTQDPIIQSYFESTIFHPGELEKKQKFLVEKWLQVKQQEKQGEYFSFADKMDILLSIIENCGKMHDYGTLAKYEEEGKQLLTKEQNSYLTDFYTGLFFSVLSFWLLEKGEIKRAIELNKCATKHGEKVNHPYLIGYIENVNGAISTQTGDFSAAIQEFYRSLEYLKKIGDLKGMAYAYNNIGVIQNTQGYFGTARESFLKSKELHLQSTGQLFRTITFSNIASTYRAEGNFVEALKNIQEGLDIERQNKQASLDLMYLLAEEIEIFLEMEDINSARNSIKELIKVINYLDSKTFKPLKHYYKGIIETRELNFGMAKKQLHKALEYMSNSIAVYRTMLKAQIQLAKIYLSRYLHSGKTEDFQQAFTLIENIIQACREQELKPLLCDILIIRANLYSIIRDQEKSEEDLMEATKIAESLGLQIQLSRTKENRDLLRQAKETISPKEKTAKLLNFLKTSNNSILSFQLLKKPKIIKSSVYGILITTESGVPIYSKYFDERLKKNDVLVSGFLSSISSFTEEILSRKTPGSLKNITHEEMTILIEKVKKQLLLILFVEKDTHELRVKISQIKREIKERSTEASFYFDQGKVEKNPLLNQIFEESVTRTLAEKV